MAAAAAMVLIAGAVLVSPSLVPSGNNWVGKATAGELLGQAAATTGDVPLQPGQYLCVMQYTKRSSSDAEHTWMYLQDQNFQTWIPADRTREWLLRRTMTGPRQWLIGSEVDLPPDAPQSPGENKWKADGGRFFGTDPDQVNFRNPTPDYLTALSHLPKLEVASRTAVLDSRSGIALDVTENGITEQIVIDPNTGDSLGSRSVLAIPWHGLEAGQILGITSMTTRIVSGMGDAF